MLIKWSLLASIVLLWSTLTETGITHSPYVPSPTDVWNAFLGLLFYHGSDPTLNLVFNQGSFIEQVMYTMGRIYGAFLFGSVIGIVTGMFAGTSRWWDATYKSLIGGIGVTPRIFLLGIFVVGVYPFGPILGTKGVVALATLAVLVYVGNAAFEIARDPEYKIYAEDAEMCGATKGQTLFLVLLPIAESPMTAVFRAGLWIAMGVVYFGEWMIAPNGLGLILSTMVSTTRVPELFVIILVGYGLAVPGLYLIPLVRHMVSIPWLLSTWFLTKR